MKLQSGGWVKWFDGELHKPPKFPEGPSQIWWHCFEGEIRLWLSQQRWSSWMKCSGPQWGVSWDEALQQQQQQVCRESNSQYELSWRWGGWPSLVISQQQMCTLMYRLSGAVTVLHNVLLRFLCFELYCLSYRRCHIRKNDLARVTYPVFNGWFCQRSKFWQWIQPKPSEQLHVAKCYKAHVPEA